MGNTIRLASTGVRTRSPFERHTHVYARPKKGHPMNTPPRTDTADDDPRVANWRALADAIRVTRTHRHLSQRGLADAADVSIRIVQYLESGVPRPSVPRVVPRIERVLDWPEGAMKRVAGGDHDAIPEIARTNPDCSVCAAVEAWRRERGHVDGGT